MPRWQHISYTVVVIELMEKVHFSVLLINLKVNITIIIFLLTFLFLSFSAILPEKVIYQNLVSLSVPQTSGFSVAFRILGFRHYCVNIPISVFIFLNHHLHCNYISMNHILTKLRYFRVSLVAPLTTCCRLPPSKIPTSQKTILAFQIKP